MKKVYRSKIGIELVVLIGAALIPPLIVMVKEKQYDGLALHCLILTFVIYLFATTKYTVADTVLRIQSGFLVNRKVDILTITNIKETYNPISSPATSIDRLQVYYDNGSSVIISPKDKKGFIAHLQQINPGITFTPRKFR
ncbi:hypothetical protein GR160_09970 [Flavobacterium sp. Sd200]|uniref:PH domain-containing protein n=1 Tax=Flavobacterium sp. Sd200 TaxID=2692211 RepID=UPI00136B4ACA|nr:PH domain-containing protein [Flavobacterium sp. Sd200]MXN91555.1 hypothetical protein [Flavobacterium sp. Sd200]